MSEYGADRPLRVAIVGSGPSGFYAAEALFKSSMTIDVDMFDRLPTPFGLVRGGVAPDHPKIKSVTRVFDRIAQHERFAFWGNVAIGRDISIDEMRRFYDALIFAYGAETDNRLGIPGENLIGSHTATEFVGWYDGHPDYAGLSFDLSCEAAVIVGQGNVAIDVARILSKTVDELKNTDIARHALEALAESAIREIHVIGRRGPVQAKFTPAELKEMGALEDCDPVVDPADLELDPASRVELDDPANANAKKNFALFQDYAARSPASKRRRARFHFLRSPRELQGDGRIERVILQHNELAGEPGNLRARGTDKTEVLPCGILFRSVGYRGLPIAGLPFDERRGGLPNALGRVVDGGAIMPGVYCVGWIKRGPTGIIGNNKPDSLETVNALLDDAPRLAPCETPDSGAVRALLARRGVRPVSYDDWRKIDAAEVERGKPLGKPREKFVSIGDMLAVLD